MSVCVHVCVCVCVCYRLTDTLSLLLFLSEIAMNCFSSYSVTRFCLIYLLMDMFIAVHVNCSLVPPLTTTCGSSSPAGSPTKGHSHSAHTSPTNTARLRPRTKSADSDTKRLVSVLAEIGDSLFSSVLCLHYL